jgi:hypothetical protein
MYTYRERKKRCDHSRPSLVAHPRHLPGRALPGNRPSPMTYPLPRRVLSKSRPKRGGSSLHPRRPSMATIPRPLPGPNHGPLPRRPTHPKPPIPCGQIESRGRREQSVAGQEKQGRGGRYLPPSWPVVSRRCATSPFRGCASNFSATGLVPFLSLVVSERNGAKYLSRVRLTREPEVVGLIREIWPDELSHRFERIFVESGYPHPLPSLNQTSGNHIFDGYH